MRRRSSTLHFLGWLVVLIVGIAVRWRQLFQSLWYDEMTTLAQYVLQPWSKIIAAGAGEYVPNNHVLHTVLAKLIYSFATKVPDESLLRVPAFVAGILVPFALAWPMRKTNPVLAFTLALVVTSNPWLVNFSTEARGYSLMLLLGIIATNALFSTPIGYVIAITLCIYTVPLAVLLIPAHGVAVLILRRSETGKWVVQIGAVLFLSVLVYLPMGHGLISYYHHPYLATISYRQFLNQLPRFALTGTGNSRPAIFWACPVVAIVIGSVLGWSKESLRPLLITLGFATLFGVVLPLVIHGATEARFVPWICLWFCIAIVAAFFSVSDRWGRVVAAGGLVVLCVFQFSVDMRALPNQPIRDAFNVADEIVPPHQDIMILYLGARESIAIYSNQAPHHQFFPAPDVATMRVAQLQSLKTTGHLPWVIIFYEKLAFDRNHGDADTRGLWTNLIAHYYLAAPRLPGRISPVAIYAPD